jgi:hypothetical protein
MEVALAGKRQRRVAAHAVEGLVGDAQSVGRSSALGTRQLGQAACRPLPEGPASD